MLGRVEVVEVKFVEFALAPESNQGLDDFKAWHMHAKITKKTLDASTAKSLISRIGSARLGMDYVGDQLILLGVL